MADSLSPDVQAVSVPLLRPGGLTEIASHDCDAPESVMRK
eukprot:CAMPEP_0206241864 /NCGR_PEP_ID=MMETSP0047_2-20121206/16739_1 /ASSEMBLY_ACC=CAM_ASM_000192 /TAXON_ID=195065 /ORGANISM="Chroomonas mesostigmatica_cf, Strain CCMP1168" /LENGTH=39 /DNA_ID= /DNA_START= /DNA_END= /DNA_ORIENTATION=